MQYSLLLFYEYSHAKLHKYYIGRAVVSKLDATLRTSNIRLLAGIFKAGTRPPRAEDSLLGLNIHLTV